jgi:tetratricopeptide (TPR) repeat protein
MPHFRDTKRTLSLDDRNTQAYILLGEAYVGRGQAAEALPYFEKAVEIQPKLTQNRLNLAGCLIEVKQYDRAEAALTEISGVISPRSSTWAPPRGRAAGRPNRLRVESRRPGSSRRFNLGNPLPSRDRRAMDEMRGGRIASARRAPLPRARPLAERGSTRSRPPQEGARCPARRPALGWRSWPTCSRAGARARR